MHTDLFDAQTTVPDDVEDALRRQEDALLLLERLRTSAPFGGKKAEQNGTRGRRDFRRWPAPEGVALELHDGSKWQKAEVLDMGIGGARLSRMPAWMLGPAPARLSAPACPGILVLADTMWRDAKAGKAGVRFEFLGTEERDEWADSLLDALLSRYSVG